MIIYEYRGQRICFPSAESRVYGDDGIVRFFDQNGKEVGSQPHDEPITLEIPEEPVVPKLVPTPAPVPVEAPVEPKKSLVDVILGKG